MFITRVRARIEASGFRTAREIGLGIRCRRCNVLRIVHTSVRRQDSVVDIERARESMREKELCRIAQVYPSCDTSDFTFDSRRTYAHAAESYIPGAKCTSSERACAILPPAHRVVAAASPRLFCSFRP